MFLHPAVIALFASSLLITGLVLYAARIGVVILARWDLASGSEHQLELERKTYLVSTILANAFAFQLASLFLFIFTADRLHEQFIGAMCAAGTLYAAPGGYATLLLKIATFLLAGLWLIVNSVDTRAYDYPLVRAKYGLLLLLAPLILVEFAFQARYLLGLEPDVITSCCGSLFASDTRGVSSDVAGLPLLPSPPLFFATMTVACLAALLFRFSGRGAYLVGALSASAGVVAGASVVSFISMYFYELPTHHCPFDILQAEYRHIGYVLYLCLAGASVAGMGVSVLAPFRRVHSLRRIVPRTQRRLALAASLLFFAFTAAAAWEMLSSDLVLG